MTAWQLFHHPLTINSQAEMWLLLPLCAAVAIVYKTIRTEDIRHLPREIASLMVYMATGLVALCAGLWLIHEYWP